METENYRQFIAVDIRKLVLELNKAGKKSSKGEPMSLAAIGRTLDPPVSKSAVSQVASGHSESARIKEAIERELDRVYWMKPARMMAAKRKE